MNRENIFTKHLPNIKLATRFDAEGREIDVETRDDAEQLKKQQEIYDILVGCGYYRAYIKGLSAFNKIVGGMVWCMEACDHDVDVDLFFDENLIIGQKIALTEKIIAILPKMQCPFQLEPHQIQGLDFINIFPVIQWLGKKSVENRKEKAKKLKRFAVGQFHNSFQLPSDKKARELSLRIRANAQQACCLLGPKRRFRRKQMARDEDENTRVRITLLEYGDEGTSKRLGVQRGKYLDTAGKMSEDWETQSNIEELDVQALLNNLSTSADEEEDFSELTEEERARMRDHLNEVRSEMLIDNKELMMQTELKALEQTEASIRGEFTELEGEISHLEVNLSEKEDKLAQIQSDQTEVRSEIDDLQTREENADKSILETVQSLIRTNEKLKREEAEFKDKCRKELAQLELAIAESERKTSDEGIEDVKNELTREQERLQGLRLQVAKQNRMIVTVQRQLDNIPDRTELAQYQKRFLELYNQVSAKHRETKQFFTLYNTLSDTKMCLQKELSFLNSIHDSYNQAMTSNHSKENFIKQLESLIDGIKQMTNKRRTKVNEEKERRDQLNEKLILLVDEQRRLAGIIKQLKIEFKTSDALTKEYQNLCQQE